MRGLDLRGKTVLLTGCNSGLGLETLRQFGRAGARIIALARSEEKARDACTEAGLLLDDRSAVRAVACELSQPSSVRSCVEAVRSDDTLLDVVLCNAGIIGSPRLKQSFGYEMHFFTNHIGHFMLVRGLLDRLSDSARVVVVSADAHWLAPKGGIDFDNLSGERGYNRYVAYAQSKLANILFAKELARRFSGTRLTANALHPGVIRTQLLRNMSGWSNGVIRLIEPLLLKSVEQGAATQCYVAAHPDTASTTGQYFKHCDIARARRVTDDAALAAQLWDTSEAIVRELADGASGASP